jgi:DNA-binding GntR family transcriptional regulator
MAQKNGIVYKTRTQMVVDILREKILSGDIKAGEPLRQDALAKEFDVSRIPVREALLQLEAQGLVHFEAHKGATATELSLSKIEELFNLRVLLEGHVLEQAIDKMTVAHTDQAREILASFDEALDTGTRIEKWSELNYAFHETLYRAADMPQTMEIIQQLNTKSDRYIRMQLLFTTGVDKAEQEHNELLELCEKKDTPAAVALLKKHIEEAGDAIRDLLQQQQTEHNL